MGSGRVCAGGVCVYMRDGRVYVGGGCVLNGGGHV